MATDGSLMIPTQKKGKNKNPATTKAGWSCINLSTFQVCAGRTTGLLTASRGEWLSILHSIKWADAINKLLLILTDHYHAVATATTQSDISKCQHRDLLSEIRKWI